MSAEMGTGTQWRSSLLERLGVQSAVVVEQGSSGKRHGAALAAALSLAIGCVSIGVHASEPDECSDNKHSVDIAKAVAADTLGATPCTSDSFKAINIAGDVVSLAVNPSGKLLSKASQLVVGSAVGAATKSEDGGRHAADLVGAALGAYVMGPVIGAYMVYDQAQNTYTFVQERQQRKLDEKLEQVSERIARVQAEETLRIRLEERVERQSLPDKVRSADQAQLMHLVELSFETGFVDPALQVRIDVEEEVERQGKQVEDWYGVFKAGNSKLSGIRANFLQGLERMNAGVDAAMEPGVAHESSGVVIRYPGLR